MTKHFAPTSFRMLATLAPAALVFSLIAPSLHAQTDTAKLHGKVTNAAGFAIGKGDVKLTTDKTSEARDRKYPYSFALDANGMYTGEGIKPGEYLAVVFVDGKTPDFQNITIKGGEDRALDFDMTRAEYLKAMTPEDRAALEEFKKKNASTTAENGKIANINQVLKQARDDEHNGKADAAVTALQGLTTAKPDEPVIWASLGEAQLASADAAAAAARAAKTNPSDPAIVQKYADTAASYQKAVDLNAVSKKPSAELAASSYLNMGSALAKAGKLPEATAAYDNSVKASPTSAGTAYFNEAAVFFNAQKLDEAAAAADKAIAADPKRAEAYYIKGQALIPKATVDKAGKYVLPAGCLEAYQQYLELDPTGKHAPEVKELLTGLGQPVRNSFGTSKRK